MKKIIMPLILVVFFSAIAISGQYDAYKPDYRSARWDIKINAFIDQVSTLYDYCHTTLAGAVSTLSSSVSSLSSLVTNWATTENYIIYCTATPTHVDGDTFTVPGDLTATFPASRIVHAYCGSDGMKYTTVASSSYATGTTTVELSASVLTSNLTHIFFVASRDGLTVAQSGAVFAADYGAPGTAAFDAAITAIGVNDRVLILGPGNWARPTSNIPANVVLHPQPGALIDPGASDLTIGKLAEGIKYQIFSPSGAGLILFGDNAVSEVYPEKWGAVADDSTDCQPAIFASLYSLPNGGVVQLGQGTYKLDTYYAPGGAIAGHIVWPQANGLWLRGSGMGGTVLHGKDHASDDYRVILIHATAAAGITNAKVTDLTIQGEADQPAVPGEGISIGDYVYDLSIDSVEAKWLRGSPYRHSASNPGERHRISNCYFHDCGTSNMTIRSTGSAGGIDHMAPKTIVENNRIYNVGSAAGGFEYWHSIYGTNDDCKFINNHTIGRGLHIRNGSKTCSRVIAAGNISETTDFSDPTHWFTNVVDGVISGWTIKNGVLKIATDDNRNITADGIVISSDDNNTLASDGYIQLIGQNITINNPVIDGRDGETTQNTGIGFIGSGAGPGITTANITINGGKIKHCVRGVQLQLSDDDTISGVTVKNMEVIGTAAPTSSWITFYIGTTGTYSDIHFDSNRVSNMYYLLDTRSAFGPGTLNNNILDGVAYGLYMGADPMSGIECIGTVADATFTNPYHTGTPPSATRLFRVADTRLLTNNGVVTLANSATPYVWLGKTFRTGGTTTITNLRGGCVGDTIYILGAHSVTIDSEANTNDGYIKLATDYSMTAGKVLVLHMFTQGCWQGVGN